MLHSLSAFSIPLLESLERLYDKRDNFNFPTVNFPFLCSNIPLAHAYGLQVFQLVLYITHIKTLLTTHNYTATGLMSAKLVSILLKSSMNIMTTDRLYAWGVQLWICSIKPPEYIVTRIGTRKTP